MVTQRRCAMCRSRNTRSEHKPHTADFGLDNPVVIDNTEHVVCADCGEESVVMRPMETTRAIVEAIVSASACLSPKEVAYLRRSMDLSQSQLGGLIGVTQEHLSRCETGKTPLGATAERLLRLMAINKAQDHGDMVDKALDHDGSVTEPKEHRLHLSL